MNATAPHPAEPLLVLALDPSTGTEESAVGAALLQLSRDPWAAPVPRLLAYGAWHGEATAPTSDAEARTWQRIRSLQRQFRAWLLALLALPAHLAPAHVGLLVYEAHIGRGGDSSRGQDRALGALLSTGHLAHLTPRSVNPSEAKQVYGGVGQKSAQAKTTVQRWAATAFGSQQPIHLLPPASREAVSDACAIGMAAYVRWQEAERARDLKARRGRKGKQP